jgi:pimeloyl-ACP methyl ester carboxylesterase
MESLRLENPAGHLRYIDFPADSPSLVFFHGMGCASTIDYPRVVANRALAGRRCLLPDMFGHGYSDAPPDFSYSVADHAETMAALLDQLAVKDALIFGHSMGGSVGVVLVRQRPDLASRLILAESNLDPGGGTFSTGIAAQAENDFLRSGHKAVVELFLSTGSPSRAATFRATDPIGLYRSAASLVAGSRPTWREQLYAMKLPRSWIAGESSGDQEETDAMSRQGIPVHVVPKAGHDMPFDNPDGLAEAIAQALAD